DIGLGGRRAALELRQGPVREGEEAHRAAQAVERAQHLVGRREPSLRQRLVERREVEQQLQRGLRAAGGVAAVRGHGAGQGGGEPVQRLVQQRPPGRARQRRPGESGGGGPLGGAGGAFLRREQASPLSRQVERDGGGFAL